MKSVTVTLIQARTICILESVHKLALSLLVMMGDDYAGASESFGLRLGGVHFFNLLPVPPALQ